MASRSYAARKIDQYKNPRIKQELPHLRRIFERSSNRRSDISVYDYDETWTLLRIDHPVIEYPATSDLTDIFLPNHPNCKGRVILIEDICKELIDDLVELLDINPEFFENHLVGTRPPDDGIRGDDATEPKSRARDKYPSTEAVEWTTRRLKKDFFSLKWYRPYTMRLNNSLVDISERLVKTRSVRYKGSEPDVWEFDCNIWRGHTHFQADGATWSFEQGQSSGLSSNASLACEERFTVWRGNREGLELRICSALPNQRRLQSLPPPTQTYLVRKGGKQTVMSSKIPQDTRAAGSDVEEDTVDGIQEKYVLRHDDRDKRFPGGVLAARVPSLNDQSDRPDTDSRSDVSSSKNRLRVGALERSDPNSPDISTRPKSGTRSDTGSICECSGHGQATRDMMSASVESGFCSASDSLIKPGNVYLLDHNPQADVASDKEKDSTVSSADKVKIENVTSERGSINPSFYHSVSLEELVRLDPSKRIEKSQHSESNIPQNFGEINLPSLPPSTLSVHDLGTSNPQSFESARLPIAPSASLLQPLQHVSRRQSNPATDRDPAEPQPQAGLIQFRSTDAMVRNNIVRNVASRCPVYNLTLEEARNKRFLRLLSSTREDVGEWLRHGPVHLIDRKQPFGPTTLIFNVIHHDVLDFLLLINQYLDTITAAADDEIMLERNIVAWRRMLWFLGRELRSLSTNLSPFAMFLSGTDETGNPIRSRVITKKMLKDLDESIAGIQKRLEITLGTLVSSISVVEARRAITETESVTRLTELAFIYIPLSFAASFFGMQVKELDPSSTSISGFFGLGVGITLLSYSVRLVIRSNNIRKVTQGFFNQVRIDSATSEGVPIRTRDAIRFIVRRALRPFKRVLERLDFPIVYVFIGIFPIVPMITVWTRAGLTSSIKLAISIVFVIIVSLAAMSLLIRYMQNRIAGLYMREAEEESLVQSEREEEETYD